MKVFNKLIIKEEINRKLFQKPFKFQKPTAMLKFLCNTDSKRNSSDLINLIKTGLSDLKDETESIFENEIEIERPNKIVDIVEKIFDFNNQNQEGLD